jgi:DNA-binding PucR family transcriptional regulator
MDWELPSERVRDLLRDGATAIMNAPQPWLDEMDAAMTSATRMQPVADDPALAAALRRAARSNLLAWAAANIRDPGRPVPANLGPEPLAIARDLARRGLTPSALVAYRVSQNVTWQRWMSVVFGLTSDAEELRELLDVSARSLFSFIDATNSAIAAQMQTERAELTRGTHAERRETVELILAGAPITKQRAASRLGYNLDQTHTAAIVWSDEQESDSSHLDQAAEAFARSAQSQRPLTVIASAATRWVWIPGTSAPDLRQLDKEIDNISGVRIAVGSAGAGIEGFRRSHLDAITTQRMVARLHSDQRIASFQTVELVSLVTQDPDRADQFMKHTLGELASANAELRNSVLAFVNDQCNVSRAATRLYTHRNTLLRRLARADQLLPRPLEDNSVNVAVALGVLHWRGSDHA